MKIASLSPDQAPPISVPLRFFIVAPVFLVLAALLLATVSGNPLADLRSPAQIAVTHQVTLGFMAMVMLGAIQQLLPVVIGSPMPAPLLITWFTLLPLAAGALLLSAGFALGKPVLLNLAWPLLGLTFLVFIAASLTSLMRATAKNATKTALLLSLLSLAGAATFGALLAAGYANGWPLPYSKLASAHVSLVLGGWVMLLIVGVSYQVVPMFQLTPNYPKWMTASLAPAVFAALLLNLALLMPESLPDWTGFIAEGIFWLLAGSFAVVTIRLQNRRRRRIPDAPLNFFQTGMVSLLLAALFSLASLFVPAFGDYLRTLSGLAFLLGFALSVMQGMLYKIIPFLVWFHLFRGGTKAVQVGVPNMKEIIPEPRIWWHFRLHVITLLAVLLAPWWNAAAWLVALGLLLQGILLCHATLTGIAVYRRTLQRIEQVQS